METIIDSLIKKTHKNKENLENILFPYLTDYVLHILGNRSKEHKVSIKWIITNLMHIALHND